MMKVLPTAQMTVLDSAEKKAHSTAQMTDLHSALKKVLHLARTKVQLTGIRWAQKKVALAMMAERISKVK